MCTIFANLYVLLTWGPHKYFIFIWTNVVGWVVIQSSHRSSRFATVSVVPYSFRSSVQFVLLQTVPSDFRNCSQLRTVPTIPALLPTVPTTTHSSNRNQHCCPPFLKLSTVPTPALFRIVPPTPHSSRRNQHCCLQFLQLHSSRRNQYYCLQFLQLQTVPAVISTTACSFHNSPQFQQ